MPMTSAAGQSLTVTFHPRRAQYFMYILNSMKVQSWASRPPGPGLIVTMASPWSNSPVNQLESSISSMARASARGRRAASTRRASSPPSSSASSRAARASAEPARASSKAWTSSPAARELRHQRARRVAVVPEAGLGAPAAQARAARARFSSSMEICLDLREALGKRVQVGLRAVARSEARPLAVPAVAVLELLAAAARAGVVAADVGVRVAASALR